MLTTQTTDKNTDANNRKLKNDHKFSIYKFLCKDRYND